MDPMSPTTNHATTTVCVSNLPNETSEADLRELFSKYGAVKRIQLFAGEPSRRSQGFGYLDLRSDRVESAVSRLDGKVFNGSIIKVSLASETPAAPPVSVESPPGATPHPDDETPSNLLRRRYEVTSVERADMPDGGQGGDWYRYVLTRAQCAG